MRQFLSFLFGVLSIFLGLAGAMCAIQTIATGYAFMIVCAVIFLIVWGGIVIYWLKNNYPDKLADKVTRRGE